MNTTNNVTPTSSTQVPAVRGPRVYQPGSVTPGFARYSINARGVPMGQIFSGVKWNFGVKPRLGMASAWVLPAVVGAYWALFPSSHVLIDRLKGIEAD